ncbi:hypothetical protein [Acidiplasma sp.]|nr:hypothetical protein [Acidiplasma sp.]
MNKERIFQAKVQDIGRVAIPVIIRRRFGIEKGDIIVLEIIKLKDY